jgi:thiol-disulfide isomerase/thioredoxin
MNRLAMLLIFGVAVSSNLAAQSGRRIRNPAPIAPSQPSLTPDPALTREPETLPASTGPLMVIPESVRERRIRALDNSSFKLADFQGKVIVINLWASWCGPCRREVPEYEKVRKEYSGRDVEFIGLTTEDPATSAGRVNKFVRDVQFGFRLGWADGVMARTLMNGRGAIPQTLVIDGEGRVISHWAGYGRDRGNLLRQSIDSALMK